MRAVGFPGAARRRLASALCVMRRNRGEGACFTGQSDVELAALANDSLAITQAPFTSLTAKREVQEEEAAIEEQKIYII